VVTLKGEHIYLRALEKEDLDFLYRLENTTEIWEISGTITPYSRNVLEFYLENAHRDIYEVKQLRLVICTKNHRSIGLIDVFDFDPQNKRAGVGIVILEPSDRGKGSGLEALELLTMYAFKTLGLRQLYANILEENTASMQLFSKLGFECIGVKKDWIYADGEFKNEVLYQKIKT